MALRTCFSLLSVMLVAASVRGGDINLLATLDAPKVKITATTIPCGFGLLRMLDTSFPEACPEPVKEEAKPAAPSRPSEIPSNALGVECVPLLDQRGHIVGHRWKWMERTCNGSYCTEAKRSIDKLLPAHQR